ncbi:DUF2207 domain-containing protein [Rhodococcus sp. IEGM 1351]|uniref:DUF2207 family protein n=1 Tax=Rhodococcus sp. IEGM 1351 TaxID=3047089 RepID=UPI0024B742A7|nr:DUF2207 domain-containing protein [Rhodococcus sp. IEGM 1351]MDI9939156.1 DUF2207 domain-containing protein [Rhodococcus sp. IEGM 1351]
MRTAVGVVVGVFAGIGLLWPLVWGPASDVRGFAAVVGDSWVLAVGVAGLSVVGLGAGLVWSRYASERLPEVPVRYGPRPGVGPAQAEYVMHKWIGDSAPAATLLHLAERGVVRLVFVSEDLWRIEGIAAPGRWARIDPISRTLAGALGIRTPGAVFVADGSVRSGYVLKRGMEAMSDACRSWAAEEGLLVISGRTWIGRAMVCLCAVLAAVGFLGVVGPTILGLPFAAFVIGALGVFAAGTGLRHTPTGRQVWADAAGFERVLSGRSSGIRSAAIGECFLAAVPYAFAFGVAGRWAATYRRATGRPAPDPDWYPATTLDDDAGLYADVGFNNLDATLCMALYRLEAAGTRPDTGGDHSFGAMCGF